MWVKFRQPEKDNPYGVPLFRRPGWGGNHGVIDFAIANYLAHKLLPDLVRQEQVFKRIALYLRSSSPF